MIFQNRMRRFISWKQSAGRAVSEMFISPPLFLDSPGLAPYLVVIAKPYHKIGYPGWRE
jgi:hypothetical protein